MSTFGEFANESQAVLTLSNQLRKANTVKAYTGRQAEFIEFCAKAFSYEDQSIRYIVTEPKVFGFLFYQALRTQRRKGRGNSGQRFNYEEYTNLRQNFNPEALAGMLEVAQTGNTGITDASTQLLGHSSVNTYLCSVLKIHEEQVFKGANNSTVAQLRSPRVEQ